MPKTLNDVLSESLIGKRFRNNEGHVYKIVNIRSAYLVEGLRADVIYEDERKDWIALSENFKNELVKKNDINQIILQYTLLKKL